MIKMVMTKTMR